MKEQQKLFRYLSELSFVCDDLRLYLDTHPCDSEMIERFAKVSNKRQEVLEEYTQKYGPIYQYMVNADNYWCWVNDPWPWEGAC